MTTMYNGQSDPRLLSQNGGWGKSTRDSGPRSSDNGSNSFRPPGNSLCWWSFCWALVVIVVLLAVLLPVILVALPDLIDSEDKNMMQCVGTTCSKAFRLKTPPHPLNKGIKAKAYTQVLNVVLDGWVDFSLQSSAEFLRVQAYMGRSRAQVIAEGRKAVNFFYNHLGFDFRDVSDSVLLSEEAVTRDDVTFQVVVIDEQNNYRCISMAGMETVRSFTDLYFADSVWVVVINKEFEFNGVKYPPGAMAAYGDYSMRPSENEQIHIHYQAGSCLINPPANGTIFGNSLLINFDVYQKDWGWGVAKGIAVIGEWNETKGRNKYNFEGTHLYPAF